MTPSLDVTYPLDRVPEALRALEAGRVRGKVAITLCLARSAAGG